MPDANTPQTSPLLELDFVPELEPVYFDYSAAIAWATKAQSGAVVTPLEHNSICTVLAVTMDALSDPRLVLNRAAITADSYAAVTYRGPGTEYMIRDTERGTQVPVRGLLPPPTDDATRLTWWQALAECAERLGVEWLENPTTVEPIPTPTTAKLNLIGGIAGTAVYPLRFTRNRANLDQPIARIAIKENAQTALTTAAILLGAGAQNSRMAAQINGTTPPAATATDMDVLQWETARKVADIYRRESATERKRIFGAIGIGYGALALGQLL